MDLKLVALLNAAVFLCLLYLSEAFSASSVSCCTELGDHIPKRMLRRAKSYKIQQSNGICNLRAIVLYTKHKILCVNPKNRIIKKWIQKKERDKIKKKPTGVSKRKRKQKKKQHKKKSKMQKQNSS
ncbi:C-C motif chemokine 28 [Rhinophrynus dorsalis]